MIDNLQQIFLREIRLLLSPLAIVTENDVTGRLLSDITGWSLQTGVDPITDPRIIQFENAYQALGELIESPPQSLADVVQALGRLSQIVTFIDQVPVMPRDGGAAAGVLGRNLAEALVFDYLKTWHAPIYDVLVLLTAIHPPAEFSLARLTGLLTDPISLLRAEYLGAHGLGSADDARAAADRLFPRIAAFLGHFGFQTTYGSEAPNGPVPTNIASHLAGGLLSVFLQPNFEDANRYAATIAFSPKELGDLGLVVIPSGAVSPYWDIDIDLTAAGDGFAIGPQGVTLFGNSNAFAIQVSAFKLPGLAVGGVSGVRLEVGGFQLLASLGVAIADQEFGVLFDLGRSTLAISPGDADSFLASVLPADGLRVSFDLGIGWSNKKGFYFQGSAGLDVTLPLSFSIDDVLDVDAIQLRIGVSQELELVAAATVSMHLGPVTATAEGIGLRSVLTFPSSGGNLGPLNGSLGFLPPKGIGIDVNAGPVSGGGFLFLDPNAGRYTGAVELSIFSIAVKAFGVIDTKFPDGHKGFSFIIVISAEFTPIQLGLGFTLLGVGGLVGINRTLDADGLRSAIRGHGLEHVLFPRDPVGDAPAIISDLAAIFPPSEGRYVFGPMAKLGWGTPTIIEAELGIVLVLPGPQLAVLGEVHSVLPSVSFPLVELNFAVAGVLDVPQKRFSIDASLHDSHIGDFPMSGDMAMRLGWGDNPNFALAIGGFNPAYKPPPGFPSLSRVTVDLGVNGNPSLTLQGYLAITSNTAQVGARAELNAHGGGLRLHGFIGFDALFVFSPFSFRAAFDAGVDVKFHGHGIGLHVHGTVSGPSPWHIDGSVCVSILFWDACLDFSKDFGGTARVELPSLDPFLGSPPGAPLAAQQIIGLKNALEDPRSWSSVAPAGAFSAVTLAERPSDAPAAVDPMGAASLHQRVVPLNRPITQFAGARPLGPGRYDIQSVTLSGGIVARVSPVQDTFAPAAFQKMSDAQKLSSPSFERMDAGVQLSSDAVTVGSIVPEPITYRTVVIDPRTTTAPTAPDFPLTARHLAGMTARSATALGGLRVSGSERFVDPDAPVKVTLADATYVVVDTTTLVEAAGFAPSRSKTALALGVEAVIAGTPALAGQLQVVPAHELRP